MASQMRVGARYDSVSLSCAGGITRHQSTMGLPKVNKNESFATLWECGLPYTIKCICQVQYPILSTRRTPWHSWVHDTKGLSNICKFILRKQGTYSQFITTGRYLRACATKCPVTVFQNNFCMVISLRMMAHRQAQFRGVVPRHGHHIRSVVECSDNCVPSIPRHTVMWWTLVLT